MYARLRVLERVAAPSCVIVGLAKVRAMRARVSKLFEPLLLLF